MATYLLKKCKHWRHWYQVQLKNTLWHPTQTTIFPNFSTALILLTIPITVASRERSFSKLKFIRSYLCSSMEWEWLNNLAILSVENDVALNYAVVIDSFAAAKCRCEWWSEFRCTCSGQWTWSTWLNSLDLEMLDVMKPLNLSFTLWLNECPISVMGQICGFLWTRKIEKAFSFRGVGQTDPHWGLCPWTPLGRAPVIGSVSVLTIASRPCQCPVLT